MSDSETLRALGEGVRAYLDGAVSPLVADAERARLVPWDIVEQLGALDFLSVGVPESAGAGLGCAGEAMLLAELSRLWGALAVSVLPSVLAGPLLAADEGAWERGGEEAVGGLVPVAFSMGSGELRESVINGSRAGLLVLAGQDAGQGSIRVVPAGEWSVQQRLTLDAVRAADVATIRVPDDAGWSAAVPAALVRQTQRREPVLVAALAVGIAEGALELALPYARQRHQFGRPIATFGEINAMLGRGHAQVLAARALLERTAAAFDRGEASDADCHAVRLFSVEVAARVTTQAQHVHGGYGHMAEFGVGRCARDARFVAALGGMPATHLRDLGVALDLARPRQAETVA